MHPSSARRELRPAQPQPLSNQAGIPDRLPPASVVAFESQMAEFELPMTSDKSIDSVVYSTITLPSDCAALHIPVFASRRVTSRFLWVTKS